MSCRRVEIVFSQALVRDGVQSFHQRLAFSGIGNNNSDRDVYAYASTNAHLNTETYSTPEDRSHSQSSADVSPSL